MKGIVLQPGEQIRSELIRLYLEPHHPAILAQLQEEVRQATNHIVQSRQDVKNARVAYALRNRLIEDPPSFPKRPSLPKPLTIEDKKLSKEVWKTFYAEENIVKKQYSSWLSRVFKLVKNIPECNWRNDSYQKIRSLYGNIGTAILFRDVVRRMAEKKHFKLKTNSAHIALEWRNTKPFKVGGFYGNRRGNPFYNIVVKVPGVGSILGRLRRPIPGRLVQGISLFRRPDGWYAAVKCVVSKSSLPLPVLSPIGVDVGQTDLVALSDGYRKTNPRDNVFVTDQAKTKSLADKSKGNQRVNLLNKFYRKGQKEKRKIKHWINSELLPKLQEHTVVFVEKLAKNFKSDKGPLSCMHVILDAIKQRLGDRVIEVNPAYTSQTCSCCGNSTEIVREGKYFSCLNPDCMATLDADINAARNILAKGLHLLESLGLECGVQPAETATTIHLRSGCTESS